MCGACFVLVKFERSPASLTYSLQLKSFSSLKTPDAVCILRRAPDQVDVLDAVSTCASLQSFLVESDDNLMLKGFEDKFESYWLERGESLQDSLKTVCGMYGDAVSGRRILYCTESF